MPREKSIKLSPKHGVNPTILVCPICGKETGLALLGRLKGDAEAPKYVQGNEPCDECKKLLDEGFIALLEAKDKQRTGRYIFVKKKVLQQSEDEELSSIYLITPDKFNNLVETYNKLQEDAINKT